MALNAFLTLQGRVQGSIKGGVTQRGREGTIAVIEASHEIMAPVANTGGGGAVGKRVHKPFVIKKELDKSSPLLYQAMVRMEDLNTWELKCYAITGTGIEIQNYTVKLTDAFITGIRFVLPNTKDAHSSSLNPYEEIEFTYRAIEWIWTDGNVTASDQWQA